MTGQPGRDHWLAWPMAGHPHTGGLWLMPERAAHHPASRTLFVADVHLGKAAVFRARGLPVPQGTTTATLDRLTAALLRSGAAHLVVLGDFLHARESHAPATLAALSRWRDRHAALQVTVVEGNHDRHAGAVQAGLGLRTIPGPHEWSGLGHALKGVHEPPVPGELDQPTVDALRAQAWADAPPVSLAPPGLAAPALADALPVLTLAGHVHPVVNLGGRRDRLRLACFWLDGPVLTLPAFGEFTGGYAVDARRGQAGQRFFVVGDAVWPLEAAGMAT